MEETRISNAQRFPEAWKVYIDCVRKWKIKKSKNYPAGWKYGIPNPTNFKEYLYNGCPGMLFMEFKTLFYQTNEVVELRKFLWWLECKEGKISQDYYKSNIAFIENEFPLIDFEAKQYQT